MGFLEDSTQILIYLFCLHDLISAQGRYMSPILWCLPDSCHRPTSLLSSRSAQIIANMVSALGYLIGTPDSTDVQNSALPWQNCSSPQCSQIQKMIQPSIQSLKSRSHLWIFFPSHIQIITMSVLLILPFISLSSPSTPVHLNCPQPPLSHHHLLLKDCKSLLAEQPPIPFLPCIFSLTSETSLKNALWSMVYMAFWKITNVAKAWPVYLVPLSLSLGSNHMGLSSSSFQTGKLLTVSGVSHVLFSLADKFLSPWDL